MICDDIATWLTDFPSTWHTAKLVDLSLATDPRNVWDLTTSPSPPLALRAVEPEPARPGLHSCCGVPGARVAGEEVPQPAGDGEGGAAAKGGRRQGEERETRAGGEAGVREIHAGCSCGERRGGVGWAVRVRERRNMTSLRAVAQLAGGKDGPSAAPAGGK